MGASAVEGGTIQCSPQSASALISINNTFGLAAKDLTVQNAANVQISGNTNSGGVVENLTVINSSVAVQQGSSSNPTIVVENQITTDTPVLLQRPDINGAVRRRECNLYIQGRGGVQRQCMTVQREHRGRGAHQNQPAVLRL